MILENSFQPSTPRELRFNNLATVNSSSLSLRDKVERTALSKVEIGSLRKDLRLRLIGFMALSVVLVLISIYDHLMVKILMMFILVVLFVLFLKFHLRLKYDIAEGEKCTEDVVLGSSLLFESGIRGKFFRLNGAYGKLRLSSSDGASDPQPGDTLRVHYLPLSNRVISWEKV